MKQPPWFVDGCQCKNCLEVSNSPKEASATLTLDLTEAQARALDAITQEPLESFLECFYATFGKHYLGPNEAGLRELFANAKEHLPSYFFDLWKLRNNA